MEMTQPQQNVTKNNAEQSTIRIHGLRFAKNKERMKNVWIWTIVNNGEIKKGRMGKGRR
jgi:hypothetical protein